MNKVRQIVFLSYSHEPPEEQEFVRLLAQRLRDVGFDTWLDEERILPGADFEAAIRKAVPQADHAVFLVTQRWLDRPYTRLELTLFENHPDRNCRLLAVRRESIHEHELAPQLQRLNVVVWMPDEREPDARFWLLYCGLTGTPQGPREGWAEEGRKLSRNPPGAEERTPTGDEPRLRCQGRPVLVAPAVHGILLATDAGECYLRGPADGAVWEELPDLRGCCAARVAADGKLVAGRYAPTVACLGDGGWEFLSFGAAPVLTLAATAHGLAVGDAAGEVSLFAPGGGRSATVRLDAPVIDLCGYENGLAALGAGGVLGRLAWAEEWDKEFQPTPLPPHFDHATELFPLGKQARVGLIGTDRIGILEVGTGQIKILSRAFPAGVRQALYLERRPAACAVLTDSGELYLLEADMSAARPVPLPGETQQVVGLGRSPTGSLLAWTDDGRLFSINRDRAVRKLAAGGVVLAQGTEDRGGRILVVRWDSASGAAVEWLRGDSAS